MNLPNNNEVIYEASLVEPEVQHSGPSLGCLIGIIFSSLFFLMIVGLAVMVSVLSPEVFAPPTPISVEADFSEAKSFLDTEGMPESIRGGHVTTHPDFERVDQFVKSMAANLDSTANKKIQKMIDHRRHWKETSRRSVANFYYDELTRSELQDLIDSESGPPPFDTGDYEIARIDRIAGGGFRVALCYDYGYQYESLFVWWLSEVNGRLLIYDWFNTGYGIRESHEYAALCDISPVESKGHDRHSKAERAYFDIDEDLEYEPFQKEIKKYLRQTESYAGPPSLKAKNQLVAAKRWAYHDEPLEALKVLDKIALPDLTPGAHMLRAEIHYESGFYAEASQCYQDFVQAVGYSPYVEEKLIQCARFLGDDSEEKALLTAACEHVSSLNSSNVMSLVELNSDAENEALYAKIDSSEDREAIYSAIASRLKYKTFYRHQFDHLMAHLESTMSDSTVFQMAKLTAASDTKTFIEALKWVNSLEAEKAAQHRYDFWYVVPDAKMLDVFKAVENKEENLKEINAYYQYENYFPEGMREMCELTLEANTNSKTANGIMASLLLDEGEYDAAIEKLNSVLKGSEKDDDVSTYNYLMLRALYKKGDSEKSIQWALSHDLVESFVNLKASDNDFTAFESLIEHLDHDSEDYKYHLARLKAHRGETDAAAAILIALIKENEADETKEVSYRIEWQLKKIFEKNDQPLKLLETFPTTERFWSLANEMIADNDWAGCEQLAQLENPSLKDAQRALRLMIDWENGKYEMLATMREGIDVLPESPSNVERVLDIFVNSSIHKGDFENAELWASKISDSSDRIRTLAGIDIREGNWQKAADRLRKMNSYERARLPTEPFAWDDAAFEQAEIAALIPPRSIYSNESNSDLDLTFLFESQPELDIAGLKQEFAPIFDGEFKSESFQGAWHTFSNEDLAIVVYKSSPSFKTPAKRFARTDERGRKVQAELLKTSSRFDVKVYFTSPIPGVDSRKIFDAVAKPFCELKPLLFGRSNMWLTPEKFEAWFEAKSKNIETLDAGLKCRAEYVFYSDDAPIVEGPARNEFALELGAALRSFLSSSDPTKTFVVKLSDEIDAGYEISVDRILRDQFRDVNLIGSLGYAEGVPNFGLVPGKVSVSIDQIASFVATFDNKKIQQKLP